MMPWCPQSFNDRQQISNLSDFRLRFLPDTLNGHPERELAINHSSRTEKM